MMTKIFYPILFADRYIKVLATITMMTLPLLAHAYVPVEDRSMQGGYDSGQVSTYGQSSPYEQPLTTSIYNTPSNQPLVQSSSEQSGMLPAPALSARQQSSPIGGEGGRTLDLLAQIQKLQQDIQELRGQIELQAHELDVIKKQLAGVLGKSDNLNNLQTPSHPLNSQVDSRVDSQEIGASNLSNNSSADGQFNNRVNHQSAMQHDNAKNDTNLVAQQAALYQAAYQQMKSRQYPQAIKTLQSYIQKYPKGQNAGSAHFWLGELYLLQSNPEKAAVEFKNVIMHFPDNAKLNDSMLRLGIIYLDKGDSVKAKQQFDDLMKRAPGSRQAKVAAEKLQQIK